MEDEEREQGDTGPSVSGGTQKSLSESSPIKRVGAIGQKIADSPESVATMAASSADPQRCHLSCNREQSRNICPLAGNMREENLESAMEYEAAMDEDFRGEEA